jgi:formylglycine-generating enzyme required for sulfatase activity
MVVVPAGSFTLGSPASEPERIGWEEQVRITIAQPFAVGRFAVTFEEWDACVAAGTLSLHTKFSVRFAMVIARCWMGAAERSAAFFADDKRPVISDQHKDKQRKLHRKNVINQRLARPTLRNFPQLSVDAGL